MSAKHLFLKLGFHGSSMNQIAREAGVTKLTVYNHFQDKATLFSCAIEETCESLLKAQPLHLSANSDFRQALYQACELSLTLVNMPEAIKLEHLLMELASEQNPLALQFYNASHAKLRAMWENFFRQAVALQFIQADEPKTQTELIVSLLHGLRHHEVLLGVRAVPDAAQSQKIIEDAIGIFMLRYG
nr:MULTISPECIES: TetR/AcrR family transcriptional regulator [Acinetobacter]